MTEAQLKEARELLHKLWGLHADGKYDKFTVKKLWARLDTLMSMAIAREEE